MTRRYTTTETSTGTVILAVTSECALGAPGEEREFWTPDGGGYVREIYPGRPGTLGVQVCDRLAHSGSTLSTARSGLLALIRHEARALLGEVARSERELGW